MRRQERRSSGPRPNCVALVPARSGSKRVKDKNVRPLRGHPLMAYSIAAALDSGVFDAVVVSTDSEQYREIARHYGAEVPFLRPAEFATADSPDIEWVEHALVTLASSGKRFECFSILRPTSPLRMPETIRRAWDAFCGASGVSALRAVERCTEHPGKMWVIRDDRLLPILPYLRSDGTPWHSSQYPTLPEVYVQNASLEIAWTDVVLDRRMIAGASILPFVSKDQEGTDVNDERDWWYLEHLLEAGAACLPEVRQAPFQAAPAPMPGPSGARRR